MTVRSSRKIAFISSFSPRKCGIATFTSDLISSLASESRESFEPLVVALQSQNEYRYDDPVKFEIRQKIKTDYVSAADYINFSHIDAVCIQHEFGLFGGDAGSHLKLLLDRVNVPIVATLHTILENPDKDYFKSTVEVCEAARRVIVMNTRGIGMLRDIYGVPAEKIKLIPHGIPDMPFVDSNYYKHRFGVEGRRTILTFGLLSKNKGIENMLRALPQVVKADPTVLYIILGQTHPEVIRHDGESYRFRLQRIVRELGLSEHVIFHNRFVSSEELQNFICATDIYVTPYLQKEQLTSGTLALAVGAGKAVVSTPYWAAEELLADERGHLVDFGNHHEMAHAIISLISDSQLFYKTRRRAFDFGRTMTWKKVAAEYWKVLNSRKLLPVPTAYRYRSEEALSITELPEVSLEHLTRMTDDTSLYQHSKFIIPDRYHGYCTDDGARAAVVAAKHYAMYADRESLRLLDIYLAFLCNAQRPDGSIRNFMSFTREWHETEAEHDALGRVIWAFGYVISTPPLPQYISIIKDYFDRCIIHVPTLGPRGLAYSILGMSCYLEQFPGASDIKRAAILAAERLSSLYLECSRPDWCWFEPILAYDNAVLPQAMFLAAKVLADDKYLQIALQSSQFLLKDCYNGNHFSFVGCHGWYPFGQKRAQFDQQPLEPASMVLMLRSAYEATRDRKYMTLARRAFDWFLGVNDTGMPMYDFQTRGCYDGLEPAAVNLNQGGESIVSFLLALLTLTSVAATRDLTRDTPIDIRTIKPRASQRIRTVLAALPPSRTLDATAEPG